MNSKSNQKKVVTNKTKKGRKIFIIIAIIICLLAVFVARSPLLLIDFSKNLDSKIIQLPNIVPLEGNLKQNNKLEKAIHAGENVFIGPETIEFDKDGFIYTGLINGQIAKIDRKNFSNYKVITQIGSQNEEICKGVKLIPRGDCGRPLGIRFRDNSSNLYVADSYNGLYLIDVKTGFKKLLLGSKDERFGDKPMMLVNDLDFDGDLIYFIDSSFRRPVSEAMEEHIEANPRGRLFSLNEKTGDLKLLLDGLYFPNGLQLMPDKNSILINENSMARILKYYLKGEKKGKSEIFAIIPGFGDTIRLTDHNTLLVPFAVVRKARLASILDLFSELPNVRNFLGMIFNLKYFFKMVPKYGLIAEYDLNGNPLKSWHDPTGKVIECTTAGAIYENKLYLGSFYNSFLGVVDYN